jgi:TrkA domain protein
MEIKISDLPGIGKKYALKTINSGHLVIILHQQGMREFYHFKDQDDDEAEYSFQLTDEEARQVGAIMLGVDYQPVADDRMELFLRNVRMEWIKVRPDCTLAGKRIDEARIRSRTGCTIIGIQRAGDVIGSPDISEVIRSGDTLMAIGKRDQVKTLETLCQPKE